jgi:hypothetical protein
MIRFSGCQAEYPLNGGYRWRFAISTLAAESKFPENHERLLYQRSAPARSDEKNRC